MANIDTSRALTDGELYRSKDVQLSEAELETRVRNIRALADSHEQFVQSRIDEQRKYLALLSSPPRTERPELASQTSQTPHKTLVGPNVRQLHTASSEVTSEIEQLIGHQLSTAPDPRYRLLNQHEAALKAELDSKSSELEKATEALREARADANLQEERAAAQEQEHQLQIKKWKRLHEIALGDEPPANRLQAMGRQLEQLQDALAEKDSELQEARLHAANGRHIIEQQQGALQKLEPQVSFLCLITSLCSYLCGGLYGDLYERAHIIRYFLRSSSPRCPRWSTPWPRSSARRLPRTPCANAWSTRWQKWRSSSR